MKKKWFVVFIALLSVFFVSACSDDSNKLSGKTFNVAYPPVLKEDVDHPNRYDSIMVLKFSDDNVVSNTIDDTEGTYELNEDVLVINFENENEKLKINFIDFKESEKDFSTYTTLISNPELHVEDASQVKHFQGLAFRLSENHPIEFIEEE